MDGSRGLTSVFGGVGSSRADMYVKVNCRALPSAGALWAAGSSMGLRPGLSEHLPSRTFHQRKKTQTLSLPSDEY